MLTEQECVEIAEKMWGLSRHGWVGRTEWWKTTDGEIIAFTDGVVAEVRSYEGMGRTLEAMRAKGWNPFMRAEAGGFQWRVEFCYHDSPKRWERAEADDLPTAVHRAALAALDKQPSKE